MASYTLLVTNPPHKTVNAQVAATVLGLAPVDANLKGRYGIPEIWLADQDTEKMKAAYDTLTKAGFHMNLIPSDDMLSAPQQIVSDSHELQSDCISFVCGSETRVCKYDDKSIVIACTPRMPDDGPPPTDTVPFVDVYMADGSRLSVYGKAPEVMSLFRHLEAKMKNAKIDKRLTNMQLRRRRGFGVQAPPNEMRKGYSYASPNFDELMHHISPGMHEMTQTEFSSRLVYLTHASGS